MKMLRSDHHMNLPADESETAPHLKKELLKMIDYCLLKVIFVEMLVIFKLQKLQHIRIMNNLWKKNPAIFALLTLMMFSLPLYLFLRHSPNIPDMRYSEFAVALVYTSNAYSIYSIIGNLLNSSIIRLFAVLIIFIALKQFSGYSKRRLLGYSTLSILIMIAILAALMGLVIYILYVTSS
jgi:hypothetical protein